MVLSTRIATTGLGILDGISSLAYMHETPTINYLDCVPHLGRAIALLLNFCFARILAEKRTEFIYRNY